MPGAAAIADTFNDPNFVGELFAITPNDTPFSSMAGAMSGGGGVTTSQDIQWQGYDLRPNGPRPAAEGANAPSATTRVRTNVTNTVMAVHETVGVTYRRQAASGQYAGLNIAGANPVVDEMSFQQNVMLEQIKLDMEWNLLRSVFFKATNTAEKSTTRGILPSIQINRTTMATAITGGPGYTVSVATPGVFTATGSNLAAGTQVQFVKGAGILPTAVQLGGSLTFALEEARTYYVAASPAPTANTFSLAETPGGPAIQVTAAGTPDATRTVVKCSQLTANRLDELMQQVYVNGGILEEETRTLMVDPFGKRVLTYLYVENRGYEETSRTMGGVSVSSIKTDFGMLNVTVNRHMPGGSLAVLSMEEIEPCWLMSGQGLFYAEELGKRGSLTEYQYYGEYGLQYGNERKHGLITGLTASGPIPAV